jgi:type IV secretory pathway VirB4 component
MPLFGTTPSLVHVSDRRDNTCVHGCKSGIKNEDRFSHIYAIGKTGTGKSTLIETMALQGFGTRLWLRAH